MHYNEINLAIEKQLVTELPKEFQKAREAVQLVKEAAEAEKQAAYTLRVEVKGARSEARVTFDARSKVEVELGAQKENHSKLAEQLKEAVKARDSAEAGLKTIEK